MIEYKTVKVTGPHSDDVLNALAKEGWRILPGTAVDYLLVMEREVSEDLPQPGELSMNLIHPEVKGVFGG